MSPNKLEQKEIKYLSKRFLIRCVCNFLMFFSGVCFCLVILTPFWSNIIHDRIIFNTQNLTQQEQNFLNLMISNDKLHTSEFVIERLVDFYETLITILIWISALGGIGGYLYIKCSHQRDITEGIQDYITSDVGNLVIKKQIKEQVSEFVVESLNSGDLKDISVRNAENTKDIEELLSKNVELEERIENLERKEKIQTGNLGIPDIQNNEETE